MTIPKIASLATIGLSLWVLPAFHPTNKYLEGLALTLAPIALLGAGVATLHEERRGRFFRREREQGMEILATSMEVQHQAALQQQYDILYGAQPQEYTPTPHNPPAPALSPLDPPSPASEAQPANPVQGLNWASLEPLLINCPATLLVGAQGAGKTTATDYLVAKRREQGHKIIVLDPHAAYGSWYECQVIGKGRDYDSINGFLAEIESEVTDRLLRWGNEPNPAFSPITIVCEEMTQWAGQVPSVAQFMLSAMSDFRKIKLHALFISHGETNALMGGADGTKATRDATLIKLELIANQTTTGPVPSGKGIITLPKLPPTTIAIPDLRLKPKTSTPPSLPSPPPPPPVHDLQPATGYPLSLMELEPPWVSELKRQAAARGGTVTVREFQQSAWAKRNDLKAEIVRDLFQQGSRLEAGFVERTPDGTITGFTLFQ